MEDSTSSSNKASQSPSLALFERLQQLRKWQEKQCEALMRTHSSSSLDVSSDSHSYSTSNLSFGTGSLKETPESQFSRSSVSSFSHREYLQKENTNMSPQAGILLKAHEGQDTQRPIPIPQRFHDSPQFEDRKDTPDSQFSRSSGRTFSNQSENPPKFAQETPKQKIALQPSDHSDEEPLFRGRYDDSTSGFSDLPLESIPIHSMRKNSADIRGMSCYEDEHHSLQKKINSSKAPLVKPVVRFTRSVEDQALPSQTRSFEDILQEKLAKEGLQGGDNDNFKPKRPFLKKRTGLAHYEGKNKEAETNYVELPPTALRWDTEESPIECTQEKPKQRFLRKGEGTARFGMPTMKLKKKKGLQVPESGNKNLVPQKHNEVIEKSKTSTMAVKVTQEPIPQKKLLKTYPNKISNRPINKLQLMEVPRATVQPEVPVSEPKNVKKKMNENQVPDNKNDDYNEDQISEYDSEPSVLKELQADKQRRKEREELTAFERLEELAADSSFSSNSSTVWHLLQKGQRSASSTPLRSPPPFMPQETPITKVSEPPQGGNVVSRNLLQRLCQAGVIPEESFRGTEEEVEEQMRNQQRGSQHQTQQSYMHNPQQQNPKDQPPQQQFSVSAVLEQLRAIVRLEETGDLEMSQEDLQTLLESFANSNSHSPLESATQFMHKMCQPVSNRTSTPAQPRGAPPTPGPRVHFRSEGVEVLEYEPSDTETEDTLTDAPSIADDTDLVTTSDLEALALLNMQRLNKLKPGSFRETSDVARQQWEDDDSSTSTLIGEKLPPAPQNKVQPLVLQFSPPSQRPHHSASNYIWDIFGRDRDTRQEAQKGKAPSQSKKQHYQPNSKNTQKVGSMESGVKSSSREPATNTNSSSHKIDQDRHLNDEIESHKALLLAKMCELEKETESFRKETLKLKNLQQSLQNEKKLLIGEKQTLLENLDKEKINFQKYMDRERNNLWKEKQELKRTAPSITMVQEKSLEIVYLKEQMQDLQEEIKKKESLNQFTMKKLNDKIKALEQENKQLKEKNASLQMLEKENLDLRHKLDRTKLSKKVALKDTQNKPSKGPPKFKTKTMTIDGINRCLSKKLTEAPVRPIISHKETPTTTKEIHSQKNALQEKNEEPKDYVRNNQVHNNVQVSEKSVEEQVPTDLIQKSVFLMQDASMVSKKEIQFIPGVEKSGDDKVAEYTESHRSDGTTEVIYANGNKKLIYPNGSVIVSYYNGDRKEVHSDRTVYIYGTDHTSHITYNDGKEVVEFPSGQKEIRFPDGASEIIFADGSKKTISNDGTEVCTMKDGTVIRTNPDGIKVFEFSSGQREIHTNKEKRREYPDGTVKILHHDGRTETHYKTGRIRIKDSEGNVISDMHQGVQ